MSELKCDEYEKLSCGDSLWFCAVTSPWLCHRAVQRDVSEKKLHYSLCFKRGIYVLVAWFCCPALLPTKCKRRGAELNSSQPRCGCMLKRIRALFLYFESFFHFNNLYGSRILCHVAVILCSFSEPGGAETMQHLLPSTLSSRGKSLKCVLRAQKRKTIDKVVLFAALCLTCG